MFNLKRLTNKQVLCGASFLFLLFAAIVPFVITDVSVMGDHGFFFSDSRLRAFFTFIVFLLPTALSVLIVFGKAGPLRTTALLILLPINLVSLFALFFYAYYLFGFVSLFSQPVANDPLSSKVGDLNVHLLYSPDVDTVDRGRMVSCSVLRLERDVIHGILSEYKNLVFIYPTRGASYEIIDDGKKVRFTDGSTSDADGVEKIERVFEIRWNAEKAEQSLRILR